MIAVFSKVVWLFQRPILKIRGACRKSQFVWGADVSSLILAHDDLISSEESNRTALYHIGDDGEVEKGKDPVLWPVGCVGDP